MNSSQAIVEKIKERIKQTEVAILKAKRQNTNQISTLLERKDVLQTQLSKANLGLEPTNTSLSGFTQILHRSETIKGGKDKDQIYGDNSLVGGRKSSKKKNAAHSHHEKPEPKQPSVGKEDSVDEYPVFSDGDLPTHPDDREEYEEFNDAEKTFYQERKMDKKFIDILQMKIQAKRKALKEKDQELKQKQKELDEKCDLIAKYCETEEKLIKQHEESARQVKEKTMEVQNQKKKITAEKKQNEQISKKLEEMTEKVTHAEMQLKYAKDTIGEKDKKIKELNELIKGNERESKKQLEKMENETKDNKLLQQNLAEEREKGNEKQNIIKQIEEELVQANRTIQRQRQAIRSMSSRKITKASQTDEDLSRDIVQKFNIIKAAEATQDVFVLLNSRFHSDLLKETGVFKNVQDPVAETTYYERAELRKAGIAGLENNFINYEDPACDLYPVWVRNKPAWLKFKDKYIDPIDEMLQKEGNPSRSRADDLIISFFELRNDLAHPREEINDSRSRAFKERIEQLENEKVLDSTTRKLLENLYVGCVAEFTAKKRQCHSRGTRK